MENYITQDGPRKDLAVNLNPPEAYIGHKLFPIYGVAEKSGSMSYLDVATVADVAAQTNRSSGSAPSSTLLAGSTANYTCAERIKRFGVDFTETKQLTLAGAEKAGVKAAARSVYGKHDLEAAEIILGGTPDDTFTAATFVTDVQTALDSMRLIEGRSALVCATSTFKWILQNSTVAAQVLRIVVGTSPDVASTGLSLRQSTYAIAILLGVDEVILGSEEHWGDTAGYATRFAIVKYDASGDLFSHKAAPVLGKTVVYLDETGADGMFAVSSHADRNTLTNNFDVLAWWNIVTLNPEAIYLFSEADGNSESSESSSS